MTGKRHGWHGLILSAVLSVTGYLAFSLWGGWHEVVAAIDHVGWAGTAVLLSLSSLNYLLRFSRWQMYLARLGHPIAWRPSLVIYLTGFALTTTPGKAGEAIRGLFLKPRGVSYSTSMAAFFSERLSDLVAVIMIAALGLSRYPKAWPLVAVGAVAVVALLILLGQSRWLSGLEHALASRQGMLANLSRALIGLLVSARRCHDPSTLLAATCLSIAAWGSEAYAFHVLLGFLGLQVDLGFAFFVYATAMLAGALSFLPGGLGSTEGTMVGLLLWLGLAQAPSVAATVVIRLTTLWFAVGVGLLALVFAWRQREALPSQLEEPG